jgi:hypothetical protein
MDNFINVSSHSLTQDQLTDLVKMGYSVIELPTELKTRWSNIDPVAEINDLLISAIVSFAEVNLATGALVAGEPGHMVSCIKALQEAGVTCFHATTTRVSEDQAEPDGSIKKVSVFKHVRFRQFPRCV